jgi:uncharacterized protein YndB with AHSA1/START domain
VTLADPKATFRNFAISRVFDAPRELVFAAWTKPEQLTRWLCPKDFQVTFVEADVRKGGEWRSGMRSPEGIDYTMRGTYCIVVEPELLVFTHAWEDSLEPGHIPDHELVITVVLLERDGKTEMTFSVTGLTSEDSNSGQRQGWSEAFDNLGAHLKNARD